MSYERARKGCEKCHQYNLRMKNYHMRDINSILYMIARDQARFNAMQALEGVVSDPLNLFSDVGRDENIAKVRKVLKACEGCDYSQPRIAELLGIEGGK